MNSDYEELDIRPQYNELRCPVCDLHPKFVKLPGIATGYACGCGKFIVGTCLRELFFHWEQRVLDLLLEQRVQ